jgi:uncharacterized membrane protein
MDIRFASRLAISLMLALPLSGCGTPADKAPAASKAESTLTAEQELARQAKAFQRTIAEGIATGAIIGIGIGSKRKNVSGGLVFGAAAGAVAGTYVAKLQKRYLSRELRLERMRDDINAANTELEASIATMQAVLDLQSGQLAAIRSQAGNDEALAREISEAEVNLANMRTAIKGADRWQQEFQSTRSLKLVDNQLTGIDAEIALLSQRIESMRKIAQTLAQQV